jgi:hypothetical protein
MVTVIGDAGVGKSRLVHEVVSRITAGATVLRGRCLPYGDGITFWPLRVMLGAADVRDDDKPEEAQAKLMSFLGDRDVVDRVAAAIGLSAGNYPLHEIYWGARKVLEILAARGPVVALVDDIHWAETAFLDLLEQVLSTSSGAPILLLATARHDLLEERPQWCEQPGASRVVLHPLSDAAAAQVVANLLGTTGLPQDVLARIVDAAEGNPLYVEQLLSMLIDRTTRIPALVRAGSYRHRRAADHPCTARGAARPTWARGARDCGARGGDRAGVRAAGCHRTCPRTAAHRGDRTPGYAGQQAAGPYRELSRGHAALPLPPSAGARHGLQRPAQT